MRILLLLIPFLSFSADIEIGKTYSVKKLKSFAPKSEDQNSIAHFILYRDAKKKHVVELFCLIPHGEDPKNSKFVTVRDRSDSIEYYCDLGK